MALKATIFKANMNIADMDRHYYQDHNLTIARHPSETDERMMIRLIAFIMNANDQLEMTKGLSTDDEPDIWEKELSGEIKHWIDLGLPDEKRIRKACGRAKQVTLFCYGGNPAQHWFDKNTHFLSRFNNITIINLPTKETQQLAAITERSMQLQISIQDEQLWVNNGDTSICITPEYWVRN